MAKKDAWKWVNRANSMYALLNTVVTVVIIVWSWLTSIPGPYIFTLGLVVFVTVYHFFAISKNKMLLTLFAGRSQEDSIYFDKPLIPPGWRLKSKGTPHFITKAENGLQCLCISDAPKVHSYYLDKFFDRAVTARNVKFLVKDWGDSVKLYVALQLIQDDKLLSQHWLTISPGKKGEQSRVSANEWDIPISPQPQDGWNEFNIDIDYWHDATFAKDGKYLFGVIGFRLRGEMKIASISWQ